MWQFLKPLIDPVPPSTVAYYLFLAITPALVLVIFIWLLVQISPHFPQLPQGRQFRQMYDFIAYKYLRILISYFLVTRRKVKIDVLDPRFFTLIVQWTQAVFLLSTTIGYYNHWVYQWIDLYDHPFGRHVAVMVGLAYGCIIYYESVLYIFYKWSRRFVPVPERLRSSLYRTAWCSVFSFLFIMLLILRHVYNTANMLNNADYMLRFQQHYSIFQESYPTFPEFSQVYSLSFDCHVTVIIIFFLISYHYCKIRR